MDWRCKSLQSVASLFSERCLPTPFVYRHIQDAAAVERRENQREASLHRMSFLAEGLCGTVGDPNVSTHARGAKRKLQQEEEEGEGNDGAPQSRRCIFCIACVNWTNRLETETVCGSRGMTVMLPLDKVLLFVEGMGCTTPPDKRCLDRLMRNLCTQYCSGGNVERNPYLRFATPCMRLALHDYAEAFYPHFCHDSAGRDSRRGPPSSSHRRGSAAPPRRARYLGDRSRDNHNDAVDDEDEAKSKLRVFLTVVYSWWRFNGCSVVFNDRRTAKYVRKMVRSGVAH